MNKKFLALIKNAIISVILVSFAVGLIFIAYLVLKEPTETGNKPSSSFNGNDDMDLSIEELKNSEYVFSDKKVLLKDGFYTEEYPDSASKFYVGIFEDKFAFGDLDSGGKKDAVVILDRYEGGSEHFFELAIFLNKDGKPAYLGSTALGDRVVVNSVAIKGNIILVDMITHKPEDALCCPSLRKIFEYQLVKNGLLNLGEYEVSSSERAENENIGNDDSLSSDVVSNNDIFYYHQSYNPDNFYIYKFGKELSADDKLISKQWGRFNVFGKYISNQQFLIGKANELYVFDAASREFKEILNTKNEKKSFMSAVLSHSKNSIAYSVLNGGDDYNFGGEIWLYDIKTGEAKKIFEKSTLMLYAGLDVLGWSKEDSKIIAREMGGDAGAIWGKIYLIDVNTAVISEVSLDSKIEVDFLEGSLNPDGEKWLYNYCQNPKGDSLVEPVECEEGEEIMVYDFKTGVHSPVYKNLTHNDNIFKGKIRIIFSSVWQDRDKVVFSIPDGIYRADIDSKKTEEIYKFIWSNPEDIAKFGSYLVKASGNYVFFERYNLYSGFFVLDAGSKKIMEVTVKNGFTDFFDF